MNKTFLISSSLGLLIPVVFWLAVPKYDPRFAGFRLSIKGLFFGFLSPIISGLGHCYSSNILNSIGYILFVAGSIIVLIGGVKHYKSFFSREIDTMRYVDPGYDLPYFDCPYCHKAAMRLDALPCKCPSCKKRITKQTASNQLVNRSE